MQCIVVVINGVVFEVEFNMKQYLVDNYKLFTNQVRSNYSMVVNIDKGNVSFLSLLNYSFVVVALIMDIIFLV